MATLKKGILGTPRGKIGNIMGYSRHGKGVLQTVPTVGNPLDRIWNIRKGVLKKQLTYIFNTSSAFTQSVWTDNAPANMTGLEYFLETNLNYYQVEKTGQLANGYYSWFDQSDPIKYTLVVDLDTKTAQITLNMNLPYWNQGGLYYINFFFLRTSGSTGNTIFNYFSTPEEFKIFDISGILASGLEYSYSNSFSQAAGGTSRNFLNSGFFKEL